jgi:hypothetical protein
LNPKIRLKAERIAKRLEKAERAKVLKIARALECDDVPPTPEEQDFYLRRFTTNAGAFEPLELARYCLDEVRPGDVRLVPAAINGRQITAAVTSDDDRRSGVADDRTGANWRMSHSSKRATPTEIERLKIEYFACGGTITSYLPTAKELTGCVKRDVAIAGAQASRLVIEFEATYERIAIASEGARTPERSVEVGQRADQAA